MTLLADRYLLERPLGHGGMAVVELARDTELDRTVAVKLLADNLARDPAFRARFLREARLAAQLAHPNVVRVYDTGESDGRPYIVMEYVEGEPLDEVVRREGRLPVDRAVAIVAQAASGLAAVHAARLVHRDVKPRNLLMRGDGVVKLTDFGIARGEDGTRLTKTGTVVGTAAYLAPEQAAGEDAGPPADVYGLGAILYELLTGLPPRRVDTLADLATALGEPVVPVRELAPDTPPRLEELVMRCLARYPEYRPASAAELAAELVAFAPDAPTHAHVRPEPSPVERPRRGLRVRLGLAAAAVALAGTGIGLAVAFAGGSSGPPPATTPAVRPVAPSTNPAQQARNLSAWLRRYSS